MARCELVFALYATVFFADYQRTTTMVIQGNKICGSDEKKTGPHKSGWAVLSDPTANKGQSFNGTQREWLGLRGLVPPRVLSDEEQIEWTIKRLARIPDNLDKYVYLRDLQDDNEQLFYQCLVERTSELMPLVYTPVVGLACQQYGMAYRRPRGLFVTPDDRGRIQEVLANWPTRDVRAVVVTDGERILGLGDLGAHGMGISIGKMALYTALGGVHPRHCLPVTLDVGTNNKDFLKDDAVYLGLKRKRLVGQEYDELVDEFMTAVIKVFGKHTLVQFEDFANQNAFKFLDRYRRQYTMFNDDIQGTAAVAVAGILAAQRFGNIQLADSKILFVGAGEAGVGIANLLVTAIGGDPGEARKKIYLKRSNRLVVKGDESSYPDHDDRRLFCHEVPEGVDITDLVKIIKWMKPNILIGVSGAGRLFTREVLEAITQVTDRPLVLPLSNPTDKSECTAEEAYMHTKGKCLFASGSPFPPVTVGDLVKCPQQCNNAYVFPGVGLAVTTARMSTVPNEVFYIAAKTLAEECMQPSDFDNGSLFPPLERARQCSFKIASNIVQYAFDNNLATLTPRPADIKAFILSKFYSPHPPHHPHHHHRYN